MNLARTFGLAEHQRARLAVSVIFFINGFVLANWVARIPYTKSRLGLDDQTLGFVIFGLAVGVLTALPLAGGLIARFGSRAVTTAAAAANSVSLIALATMPTPLAQAGALFVFGATTATMDIAMNAQGVEVERRAAKPIMSSFHALFSLGGVAGAALTSLIIPLQVTATGQFAAVCAACLVVIAVCWFGLVDIAGERAARGQAGVFALPGRELLPLGAVVFCAAIGEGTMVDWSGVYMEDTVLAAPELAPLGYAAFSALMTVGRLLGDFLTARFDRVRLVRGGGLLAAAGLLLAIVLPQPIPSIIGFAAVGAGLSFIIPLAYSVAGNLPGLQAGRSLAGVATIGYSAFLAGPPIIGFLANAISLRLALVLILVLVASLVFSARALRAR